MFKFGIGHVVVIYFHALPGITQQNVAFDCDCLLSDAEGRHEYHLCMTHEKMVQDGEMEVM